MSVPSIHELSDLVTRKLNALEYPREAKVLENQMRYGLEAGGKHLRPVLTVATCAALGGTPDDAINQALGVEIFHNFTLVHDDVMDRSELRRGKPALHTVYGDARAILAGDAMLTLANMTVRQGAGKHIERVLDTFDSAAMDVYAGQELDMTFEGREDVTPREYLQMIMLKTAALVRCACQLGAMMADASERSIDAMRAYALGLGMAFQLRDDYLDTYGDEKSFGKPIGGDIVNGKKTWLLTTALTEAAEQAELRTVIADPDMEAAAKINAVRSIFDELNLPKRCQELIEQYSNMAIAALEDADMSSEWREFFKNIVLEAKTRIS